MDRGCRISMDMAAKIVILIIALLAAAPAVSASMTEISVENLTIITEGGTAGGSSVWVEDVPVFTNNEKVLVFLKSAGGNSASWAGRRVSILLRMGRCVI